MVLKFDMLYVYDESTKFGEEGKCRFSERACYIPSQHVTAFEEVPIGSYINGNINGLYTKELLTWVQATKYSFYTREGCEAIKERLEAALDGRLSKPGFVGYSGYSGYPCLGSSGASYNAKSGFSSSSGISGASAFQEREWTCSVYSRELSINGEETGLYHGPLQRTIYAMSEDAALMLLVPLTNAGDAVDVSEVGHDGYDRCHEMAKRYERRVNGWAKI